MLLNRVHAKTLLSVDIGGSVVSRAPVTSQADREDPDENVHGEALHQRLVIVGGKDEKTL